MSWSTRQVKAQGFVGIRLVKARVFVGIQRVKARGFVGTRKMKVGFVGVNHGIGELKIAGIQELDSAVADDEWEMVAVAGLAKCALVPRIGFGFGRGTEHCMIQVILAIVGTEVGSAAVPRREVDSWAVGIVVGH